MKTTITTPCLDEIYKQENKLFEKWQETLKQKGDFIKDGLLFRSKPVFNEKNGENGKWQQLEHGNNEENWLNAFRRLLIITKEPNESQLDIRMGDTGRQEGKSVCHYYSMPFYRNLRYWSYGLLKTTTDNAPIFEDITNDELGIHYETAPIARINCIKYCNENSTTPTSRLDDALNIDDRNGNANFLIEQIKIYDANIILCCGKQIFDFVKKNIYHDLKEPFNKEEWIYYSAKDKVFVINSYHPSYFGKSTKVMYDDMVRNFQYALNAIKE